MPQEEELRPDPAASELHGRGSGHAWLTWIAFACASVSGVAILGHAFGFLPMYFLVDILGPPGLIGLLVVGIYAKRVHANVFLNRLLVGSWAGIVATLCYDAVRYPMYASGLVHFNPFRSHPLFGELITGQPSTTWTAILVGWAYHFWNGFGFAIMYTVIAGNAWWVYAVIWALILEIAWLMALPSTVNLQLTGEALFVSLTGHGLYGVILGLLSQRFIRK